MSHFLEIVKTITIQPNDLLDIVFLFTSIPTKKTIHIAKKNYKIERNLLDLVYDCIKN